MQVEVGRWKYACRFLGPLRQLEAGAGKNVAETCFFPFARVVETVEIKVPNMERIQLVGLYHGIGGAFDAPGHAQRLQQVANQRGLASTQVAMQGDKRVPQRRLQGPVLGEGLRRRFVWPNQRGTFYNGRVTINSVQDKAQFSGDQLVVQVRAWAQELGFSQIGVAGVDLSSAEAGLLAWLSHGFHGDMGYMAQHGLKRARPAELVPGTVSVITARMDYLPQTTGSDWQDAELARLQRPFEGVVSLYARGRDYHKVLRNRLQKLADRLSGLMGPLGYRVFTDSAPVLEAELAARIQVSLDTIRNWEQGKRSPTGAAKALLKVLDKAPEAALAALH